MSQTVETPATPTNTTIVLPTVDKEYISKHVAPRVPTKTRTKYVLWNPGCLTEEQVRGKPIPPPIPVPVNIFLPAIPSLEPRISSDCEASFHQEYMQHQKKEDLKTRALIRHPTNIYDSWPVQDRRWAVVSGNSKKGCPKVRLFKPQKVRLLQNAQAEEVAESNVVIVDVTDDRWMSVVLGMSIAILVVGMIVALIYACVPPVRPRSKMFRFA